MKISVENGEKQRQTNISLQDLMGGTETDFIFIVAVGIPPAHPTARAGRAQTTSLPRVSFNIYD